MVYLTEAAVDTLGHVDVVARGATRAVRALLRLDGDGLRTQPCVYQPSRRPTLQ